MSSLRSARWSSWMSYPISISMPWIFLGPSKYLSRSWIDNRCALSCSSSFWLPCYPRVCLWSSKLLTTCMQFLSNSSLIAFGLKNSISRLAFFISIKWVSFTILKSLTYSSYEFTLSKMGNTAALYLPKKSKYSNLTFCMSSDTSFSKCLELYLNFWKS